MVSAYIYFCNEMRPVVKAEMPGLPSSEIFKELGKRWRSLSDEEKAPYMASVGKNEKKISNKKSKKVSGKKQPKKSSVKKQPKKPSVKKQPKKASSKKATSKKEITHFSKDEYNDKDYKKISDYLNKILKKSRRIHQVADKMVDFYVKKGHLFRNVEDKNVVDDDDEDDDKEYEVIDE